MCFGLLSPVSVHPLVSCCHFLLPAHLCSRCYVSHTCLTSALLALLVVYVSLCCSLTLCWFVCSHPLVSCAPVPWSSRVHCVPDLFPVVFRFVIFPWDFPLPVFCYLLFGFHIGHQLNKACFLFSTCLPLCVCIWFLF